MSRLEKKRDVPVVELIPSLGRRCLLCLPLDKLSLLIVNNVLAGEQVDLVGRNAAALGDDHVANDEDEIQGNAEVASNESSVVKLAVHLATVEEDGEVLGECDDAAEEEGDVASPDAQGRAIGHDAVGDILCAAGLDEVDVRNEDGDPGEQTEDGGEIDKVLENLLRVIRHVHECQAAEQGADNEGGPRHTAVVGALEDTGGILVASKAVQGAAGNVQIRVGGREDKDEDAGVDDVGEHLDTGQGGGDDKGRGVGTSLLRVGKGQLRLVVGHNHSDKEDAADVEDEDTEEGELDGLGDSASGVLCLARRHTNKLGTQVSKGGVDHDGPEGDELGQSLGGDALARSKGTGFVPVLETGGLAIGAAAGSNDDAEQDDAENNDDLGRGQPELKLAKELDTTEVVDAEDGNEKDGDEDARIDPVGVNPFLNN